MAYRRTQFLIDRGFQLKFSFFVCSWILALSLFYPLLIDQMFEFFLVQMQQSPQAPETLKITETRQQVLWLLVLVHSTFIGVTFLISLFVSHRIAGPLYKLRIYLEQARDGNLGKMLHFRKSDYFQDLANTFNQMSGAVQIKLEQQTRSVDATVQKLESLAEQMSSPQKQIVQEAITALRAGR